MNAKSFLVNALTFARVPLIFLWAVCAVVCELGQGSRIALTVVASLAMLLSGLTDLWDGQLARKWHVVSTLGKMADPLMDKIFYLVAFPTLLWLIPTHGGPFASAHALVMLLFTILYMLRDSWVTFLRSVGALFGADVAAMWLGKVRTALSFPGAGWVYAYLALSPFLKEGGLLSPAVERAWVFSCFAVEGVLMALTVLSLVTYTRSYWPYLKKSLSR